MAPILKRGKSVSGIIQRAEADDGISRVDAQYPHGAPSHFLCRAQPAERGKKAASMHIAAQAADLELLYHKPHTDTTKIPYTPHIENECALCKTTVPSFCILVPNRFGYARRKADKATAFRPQLRSKTFPCAETPYETLFCFLQKANPTPQWRRVCFAFDMVDSKGLEPLTPCTSSRCSTS